MKMRSLKKMGLWLTLAALTSTPTVQAHHSGHHSSHHHSHHDKRPTITNSELTNLLVLATTDVQLNITDLSTLFTVYSATRDPQIKVDLTTSYEADLVTISQQLGTGLSSLGVSSTNVTNFVTAFDNLNLALINYAALVLVNNPDPDTIAQALNAVDTAGQALAVTLVALSSTLDQTTVNNLVTTSFNAQIAEIQSDTISRNYADAIANRNIAIQAGETLVNYIVKKLSNANLKVIHG